MIVSSSCHVTRGASDGHYTLMHIPPVSKCHRSHLVTSYDESSIVIFIACTVTCRRYMCRAPHFPHARFSNLPNTSMYITVQTPSLHDINSHHGPSRIVQRGKKCIIQYIDDTNTRDHSAAIFGLTQTGRVDHCSIYVSHRITVRHKITR